MVGCKGDEDEEDEQERLHVLTIIENRHLGINLCVFDVPRFARELIYCGVLERVRRFYIHPQ